MEGEFKQWAGIPSDTKLQGWELIPLVIGGETTGIAALSGTEIHFALKPDARLKTITRKRAREFVKPLLSRRGYLTTRVLLAGNHTADDFVKRMGFELTNSDGMVRHYMLCALPFERGN
jgi:hypothetical protein